MRLYLTIEFIIRSDNFSDKLLEKECAYYVQKSSLLNHSTSSIYINRPKKLHPLLEDSSGKALSNSVEEFLHLSHNGESRYPFTDRGFGKIKYRDIINLPR
jgi:hypothetical protein